MQVDLELARHTPDHESVITLGVFDGVHLGHQALIRRTIAEARARGLLSAVVVMHPHPRTVLSPGSSVLLITSLEERMRLIQRLGVDMVVPLTFTYEISQLTAREFMTLLRRHLKMAGLIAGPDFALGKGREGTSPILTALGAELGYEMTIIEPYHAQAQPISSTAVRQALAQGKVDEVTQLLGRRYVTRGTVRYGDKRGQWLGYPTANIAPESGMALPGDGIYATRAAVASHLYPSATYVGTRPTFDGKDRLVEVFLLDYEGDLYGQELAVEWVEMVREDRKFDSPDALKDQMALDIAQARGVLNRA